MDRQELLEKKRQRLLELKLRRSAVPNIDLSVREVPETVPLPQKVDFAVQVDLPHHVRAAVPTLPVLPVAQETHKIDKAVQTYSVELDEEFVESAPPDLPEEELAPDIPTDQLIQQALEKQLSDLGFSDLRLGIKHKSSSLAEGTPFDSSFSIDKFLDRPIACLATTQHHLDLLLVAYGARRQGSVEAASLPGLAVLFNRSKDSVTPEFFLQCTDPISKIAFDNSDPFRIVAGLENGRVVMWDLTSAAPTQVAVLPTLQTSYISSLTQKSQLHFIHHVSPIVFMKQLNIESLQDLAILTICQDGVINVWSPNFLALPKFSSIELGNLLITDALLVPSKLLATQHHEAPEYRFLDLVLTASANGVIYRLANRKERNYVATQLSDSAEEVHSVSSIVELSNSLILSAHSDFFLRIWHSGTNELLFSIPTATLVSTVLVRPRHPNQVITLGTLRIPEPGFFVELWDFDVNAKGPVLTFPTRKELGIASFSHDGGELIIGYQSGQVDVWKIDDTILLSYIAFSDSEGIFSLLSLPRS